MGNQPSQTFLLSEGFLRHSLMICFLSDKDQNLVNKKNNKIEKLKLKLKLIKLNQNSF